MARKILIADDEQAILDTVGAYLKQEGYDVLAARDGREALYRFRDERPDLVILDVMMPELDGWSVARAIRKESDVPLLFLTARADEVRPGDGPGDRRRRVRHQAVQPAGGGGPGAGPVAPGLRRAGRRGRPWRVGALEVDVEAHTVIVRGERADLTPSEFGILQTLIARPGRVFTRMELLDRLQGEAYAAYERTVDVHVKNLRAKIEADPRQPEYVETVYGVGYRLRPEHG